MLLRVVGRGKTSGVKLGEMRTKAANLFQVCGSKITRLVLYVDQEQGLAELGLSGALRRYGL